MSVLAIIVLLEFYACLNSNQINNSILVLYLLGGHLDLYSIVCALLTGLFQSKEYYLKDQAEQEAYHIS